MIRVKVRLFVMMCAVLWHTTPGFCQPKTPQGTRPFPVPVVQEGHDSAGGALQVAISRDRRFVVSADYEVKLWNTKGELLRNLEPPSKEGYYKPIFTPDGRGFVLTTPQYSVVYALPSGRKVRELAGVQYLDGARLTLRRDEKTVKFADARTGWTLCTLPLATLGPRPATFDLSPDGRLVAIGQTGSAGSDGKLRILNLATGKFVHVLSDSRGGLGAQAGVLGPAVWSPDGRLLVTCGEDPHWHVADNTGGWQGEATYSHAYAMKVWDLKTGKLLRVWPGYGSTDGAFSAERFVSNSEVKTGKRIVSVWTGKDTPPARAQQLRARSVPFEVRLESRSPYFFDLVESATGKVRAHFPGSSMAGFDRLAWSPEGSLLAAAGSDAPVRVFDAHTGALMQSLKVNEEAVLALRWLPNGNLLAGTFESVYIWRRDGRLMLHYRTPVDSGDSKEFTVSPDGTLFVTQGDVRRYDNGGLLHLRNAQGVLIRAIPNFSADQNHRGDWHPEDLFWLDNSRVLLVNNRAIEIHNLLQGTLEAKLPLPSETDSVVPEAVSPDANWLLCRSSFKAPAGSRPSRLLLWNVPQGRLVRTYDNAEAPQWSHAAQAFIARITKEGTPDTVGVFSPASDQPLRQVLVTWDNRGAVVFSPDGSLIAKNDDGLKFYRADTGHLGLTLYLFLQRRLTKYGEPDLQAPATWLALTPSGYYDGSADAEARLRWRRGDTLLPVGAFSERRRPDQVRAALSREMPVTNGLKTPLQSQGLKVEGAAPVISQRAARARQCHADG